MLSLVSVTMIEVETATPSLISVVIPAFKSATFISETIDRVLSELEDLGYPFELIVVNDGGADDTWDVVQSKAHKDSRILAVCLLRNYGQHSALLCGLRHAGGSYVITMDDDLQNPPEEIPRMLNYCILNNHDLVIAEFLHANKTRFRMFGTIVVNKIVTKVFNKPPGLKLSTFRVIRRDVVDRICQSTNPTPYITGELLFAASSISNISVRHDKRIAEKSTYNPFRIIELVRRITFSYSIEPLRIASKMGVVASVLAFLFSSAIMIRSFIIDRSVPGWSSVITAVSFFSAIIILLLSMLGEYLSVVLLQTARTPAYREVEIIKNRRETHTDTVHPNWPEGS